MKGNNQLVQPENPSIPVDQLVLLTICLHHFKYFDVVSLLLNGRLDIKAAPLSPLGLFVAHILPPCTPIIFFEIKSPRPVPFPDVVSNFENSYGAISVSIPEPLSFTITITSRMLLSLLIYNNTNHNSNINGYKTE